MSFFSERPTSLGFPARGGHLDRLHSHLLDLDGQLREAVSQAIGQMAAGVVRQVVRSLLGPGDDGPTLRRYPPREPNRNRPLWQTLDQPEERDQPPWFNEREEDVYSSDRERDTDDDPMDDVPQPSLWRQLLIAALPALGWWLNSRAGRRTAGAALGCGVVCGLALYFGGRQAGGTGLALTLLTESVAAVAALGARDQS
jgi:hypothetical protein